MITAGLENPTQDVSKAIAEAEATDKGRCSKIFYTSTLHIKTFHPSTSLITCIIFILLHMLSDANKKPADNLKLAALDMDTLFSKIKSISKGVLFNVRQSLLK